MSINPRKKACLILTNIDKDSSYINVEMNKLRSNGEYSNVDERFIGEIVNGVIKYKLTIDYLISKYSDIKIKKISPFILSVLRSGIYQIIYMDKVPDFSAVDESVKLVKKSSCSRLSGFVNAILRKINKNEIELLDESTPQGLSIKYSFPLWMVDRWINKFGKDFTLNMLKSLNERPSLYVRRCMNTSQSELISYFDSEDICYENITFDEFPKYNSSFKINNIKDLNSSKAYLENKFYIQDPAASLASYLLDAKSGETVLDLCASPGGKSIFTAELMGNRGKIISCDIYEHKLKTIKDNAKRYCIDIIETLNNDATIYNPDFCNIADRIICDVPCSGLGIIKKKPDIKYTKSYEDIVSLKNISLKILNNASKYLKKGGVMIFSTCTIDKEENEDVVNDFLLNHPDFSFLPFGKSKMNYKTFYPHIDHTDGFFICRLIRNGEI